MKAVTKLYLTQEERTKIETMMDDIESFLIDMEFLGDMNKAYDYLATASDNLQLFLDEIEALNEED